MKLDPGMHIGLHLVFFGKSGVTVGIVSKGNILVGFLRLRGKVEKKGSSYFATA
jgi:hypothetical protein